MATIKITIVGDGRVGKTSIYTAYVNNSFSEKVPPTIFDDFEHSINIFGMQYNLHLCDTGGQEDYKNIRTLSYPNTDVYLLCYGIDDRNSYDNIKTTWINDIQDHKAPIILVGTKQDLRIPNSKMCITPIEGLTLGKLIKAETVIECSAKESININKIFEEAVRAKIQQSQNTEEQCKCKMCEYCEIM